MTISDFSGHLLIPHLSTLENRFIDPLKKDDARFRSAFFDLEMLPYALGGAWHAWHELARAQQEIVAAIPLGNFERQHDSRPRPRRTRQDELHG